jgi:enterochelin esterase family protein
VRDVSPAVEAVRKDPSRVDELWERAVRDGTPLIEGTGPERAYTWLFRGDAHRVALVAGKLTDDTTMDDVIFDRVGGTDLFALTLRLGSGWRGTYAIAVDTDNERLARALAMTDPSRHERVRDWYSFLAVARPDWLARESFRGSSVAAGPDAPARAEVGDPPRAGRVQRAHVPSGRDARWYLPDGIARASRVLVMLDGDRRLTGGAEEFDSWAHAHLAPDTAVLLLGHGALEARDLDLTCNPALVSDLRELLDTAPIDVPDDPAATAIQGSSLGGLAALYAQCVAPDRFGVSICQSPSFWWPNAKSGHEPEWLTTALADSSVRLDRVHLSVGTDEWVLIEPVRRMRKVVASRADRLDYEEFDGGHDAPCWEAGLPRVLREFGF